MDLDAIPTAEWAYSEAILPPGHHGTEESEQPLPGVPDGLRTAADEIRREARYQEELARGLHSRNPQAVFWLGWSIGRLLMLEQICTDRAEQIADPQPEPCVECDGSRRSQITTRGHVVPINCPHCDGRGVMEP